MGTEVRGRGTPGGHRPARRAGAVQRSRPPTRQRGLAAGPTRRTPVACRPVDRRGYTARTGNRSVPWTPLAPLARSCPSTPALDRARARTVCRRARNRERSPAVTPAASPHSARTPNGGFHVRAGRVVCRYEAAINRFWQQPGSTLRSGTDAGHRSPRGGCTGRDAGGCHIPPVGGCSRPRHRAGGPDPEGLRPRSRHARGTAVEGWALRTAADAHGWHTHLSRGGDTRAHARGDRGVCSRAWKRGQPAAGQPARPAPIPDTRSDHLEELWRVPQYPSLRVVL